MNLGEYGKKLALLQQLRDAHKEKAKQLDKLIDDYSQKLFEVFVMDGVSQVTIEALPEGSREPIFTDGRNRIIKPDPKIKAYVTAENTDSFHEWLRDNGHGSIIKTAVNANTLNGWVEKQKKSGGALPPENLINLYTVEKVKVTKARTKAK